MTQDKHHGQGGSYVVNPKTGERELAERTLAPGEAALAADLADTPPAGVSPEEAAAKAAQPSPQPSPKGRGGSTGE